MQAYGRYIEITLTSLAFALLPAAAYAQSSTGGSSGTSSRVSEAPVSFVFP